MLYTTPNHFLLNKIFFKQVILSYIFSAAMMMRVEDVIIKTLLSAENTVATACKMFMPYKGNCFGKLLMVVIEHVI